MNNTTFLHILRFILLVLAQVLIANTLNFLGFINPMIYVIFLYWYSQKGSCAVFMLVAFLLGFSIDVFSDTLALHALASVTVAYARPVIMRLCFGTNHEFQSFSFKTTTRLQRISFLGLLILLHHGIFFSLEILSISHFLLILKKTITTGIASLVLCLLLNVLFGAKRR